MKYNKRTAVSVIMIIILLFTALPVFSEAADTGSIIDPSVKGVGYSAILYDSSNGLPTSEANAIVQSPDGFIWIGGYSGLVRYDGNEFLRYDSSYGITSVFCLFVDSRERLFIGTNDNGVAMLKDNEITFYNGAGVLNSSYVRDITEDGEGNVLVATTMGMGVLEKDGNFRAIDELMLNSAYIDELMPGADGSVFGMTHDGDVFRIRGLHLTDYWHAGDMVFGSVNTICPDPSDPDMLWLGTREGDVIRADVLDGLSVTGVFSTEPAAGVNCVRVLEGQLWVCTDLGAGVFRDGSYNAFENLPMDNSIDGIMPDHEGNLWFTSSRQGVMKISRNRFTDINQLAHITSGVVNTTFIYDGLLYAGTDTGLIILDQDYTPIENGLTEYMSGERIRCINVDSEGNLWFCTYGHKGLVRYDVKDGETISFTEDSGMSSNRTRTVIELREGGIAAATNSGVNIIKDGAIIDTLDSEDGVSNSQILCLEQGPDGTLYLGSDGDGVYAVKDGAVTRTGKDDGLKSEVILRLRLDPLDPSVMWIVTSNSIAFMKDGRAETVTGFPYNNNFDMYFDGLGRVWFLSSNGIYVADREQQLKNGSIDYMFYDSSCGLPHITTANSFSCLRDDGTLFIACSTGITAVNVNDDTAISSDIRLAVPYLTVDDEYVPVNGSSVTVPAGAKRITIHPFAFTYSLNNPRVSYQLEGFDDSAFVISKRELSEITYTNLDGGSYSFVLSVVDPISGEAVQTLRVGIEKSRSLTELCWFWAIIAAAAIAAVVTVQQLFNRRRHMLMLKKQEEQRSYINGMIRVLSGCVEMKDPYTNGHAERVAKYTAMLAEKLGKSKEEIERMYNIAMLHDVGKISIPDAVLNKPERLTNEEYALMKSHTSRGYDMLKDVSIAPELALGAGYHHERWDGKGYPRGLKGEEIPEVARIISVADAFDAMYSTRPYRKRLELSYVAGEIEKSSGTQLCPEVVKAFMELYHEGKFDNE